MERHKLLCTEVDMTNLKNRMQKMDIVDICTRERANTNWKFFKFRKLTIFASLLKNVPMGCKDTVLPEPVLRECNENFLTFEKNTRQSHNDSLCLFRELALHLHGNKKLKETSMVFSLSSITVRREKSQFSKVFISMTFQKLKTCRNSISSFLTLIL